MKKDKRRGNSILALIMSFAVIISNFDFINSWTCCGLALPLLPEMKVRLQQRKRLKLVHLRRFR